MCDTEKEKKPKPNSEGTTAAAVNIAIRTVNMGLAVAAAALMATATECTVVLPNPSTSTLRTHAITYQDFNSYVYLVWVNSISAILVGIAIYLSVSKKGDTTGFSSAVLSFIDSVVPALLDSATGAAFFTVGSMTFCAAPGRHVSICVAAGTGTFCAQVNLAIRLSIGAVVSVKIAEVVKNEQVISLFSGSGSAVKSEVGSCDCKRACGHGCSHQ